MFTKYGHVCRGNGRLGFFQSGDFRQGAGHRRKGRSFFTVRQDRSQAQSRGTAVFFSVDTAARGKGIGSDQNQNSREPDVYTGNRRHFGVVLLFRRFQPETVHLFPVLK